MSNRGEPMTTTTKPAPSDFPFLCALHGGQAYTFITGYLRRSLTGEREQGWPDDMATTAKDLYDVATGYATGCADCAAQQRAMDAYYAKAATA